MQCDDVILHLAQTPDVASNESLPLPVKHHLATCLSCQAEQAQYRRLHRELQGLRHEVVFPDDQLLVDVLDSVRPPATVTQLRPSRRKAYVGGIAAAATAGAAGALVLVSKLSSKGHPLAG
jgi:anti-sigma factor RsiW